MAFAQKHRNDHGMRKDTNKELENYCIRKIITAWLALKISYTIYTGSNPSISSDHCFGALKLDNE